jgi:hypothetical protein
MQALARRLQEIMAVVLAPFSGVAGDVVISALVVADSIFKFHTPPS